MHPTIDEQVAGIARLVEQAAGRIDDDPLAERLRAAAGTLRHVAASWWAILPYLTWDNEATLALLEGLGTESRARARQVAAGPLDPLDVTAVHARNLELRALLAEAVRALPPAGGADTAATGRAAVTAHVRERVARDPSSGRLRRAP